MTAGFAFLTVGTLMLLSAVKNRPISDILQGFTESSSGPGDRGFISALKSTGESAATGFIDGITPESAGPLIGGALGSSKKQKQQEAILQRDHPELKPGIRTVAAIVLLRFPGLTITSTTGGTHASGSFHYKGRAVDIGGSTAEMNRAAKWIAKYLRKFLSEGIHNPGLSVDDKKSVSSGFWGSETWAGHADHIHLAV